MTNHVKPNIRLVVSDVDGTFITKSHEITPATLTALERLREQGITVVLASSRPPRGMTHFLEAAGMNAVPTPFVGMNGAIIGNTDGTLSFSSMLEAALVQSLYEAVQGTGANVMLLDANGWWSSGDDDLVQREARSLRFLPDITGFRERLAYPANKMTLLGSPESVEKARELINARFAGQVSASSPANPKFLDITAPNVHKGTAIVRLAEMFGLKPEEICAIGDGENDIPMFHAAGTGIAMGHAAESVKSHATHITHSHAEDGWAHAMEQFVLSR
jgi:Cof subfamily protein (haloacid dehalogenase superfamily)